MFLFATPVFGQTGNQSCNDMEYEHRNQIDNKPYSIRQVKGTASDPNGFGVPNICIGIFTVDDHKLVATTETDENGAFEIRNLPAGEYRLVGHSVFCPANVRLLIQPKLRRNQELVLRLIPTGIDQCSYGELTKPERKRRH